VVAPWPLQYRFILRPPISTSWCGLANASPVAGAANKEGEDPPIDANTISPAKPLLIGKILYRGEIHAKAQLCFA
jgi:hypothetical protein